MKKVLITGKNSYIGTSVENWLMKEPDNFQVDSIDMKEGSWKEKDFSQYDVVFHVAGIAHVSSDKNKKDLYYKVNRDLTIEAAEKAKAEGVNQFIFMSSIIVYGDSSSTKRVIDENTVPTPSDFYGDSKLQAEQGIMHLESDDFKIVVVRPPMIYGKGSKGNYQKLSKLAQITPIFPDIDNERSMLHIDNLCEFLKFIIINVDSGIFFPQNSEFMKTSALVKYIAEFHNKNIRFTYLFNPIINLLGLKSKFVTKLFGNLVYNKELSKYKNDYQIRGLKDSIQKTEKEFFNEQKSNIDILLISDNGLETVGGEQESTKVIIQGIKDIYSIGVIQPGELKNPWSGLKYFHLTNVTRIKHLVKNPLSFFKYILKLRKIICVEKPDIIHTQAQVSFFIISLLSKFKLIPNHTKLIHTERGLYTKYNSLIKKIFHFFINEIDVLVTTTDFNMKFWKEALNSKNQFLDYKVIENTAGELFETYNNDFASNRENTITLGFAGRYCDWKNWPLAVDICKELNNEIGDKLQVKMAVGCLDDISKQDTKKMFNQLIDILGNRFEGVINININEMEKFYYDIDVFALTSKYNTESFGRTLVEAMSRKTVVLTTKAGGAVEVVGNSSNVCDSSQDFKERILEFHNDKRLMEIEKNKNLSRVKERYSLKNNLDKHLNLYDDLLKNKNID